MDLAQFYSTMMKIKEYLKEFRFHISLGSWSLMMQEIVCRFESILEVDFGGRFAYVDPSGWEYRAQGRGSILLVFQPDARVPTDGPGSTMARIHGRRSVGSLGESQLCARTSHGVSLPSSRIRSGVGFTLLLSQPRFPLTRKKCYSALNEITKIIR